MVLNLKTPINDYNGKPLLDQNTKKPTILRDVVLNALNYSNPNDKKVQSVKERVEAYKKSMEVVSSDKVDFTVEELSVIKENVNKIYLSPLMIGRVSEIIDAPSK